MKLSAILSLVCVAALTTVTSTAEATTFAFKRPLTNAGASDNSKCTGATCSTLAKLTLDIQAAKNGTGAATPPTDGGQTTPPGNTGPTVAEQAEAARLVAVLNWQARTSAWSAAVNHTCGTDSATSCSGVTQIGAYRTATYGFQTFNLVGYASSQASAGVCVAAASLGASCSNGTVSVSFNAGSPVVSYTPATLTDTAQALYPGEAP